MLICGQGTENSKNSVTDDIIVGAVQERAQVTLQIGACTLRARSNRIGLAIEKGRGWRDLIDMRPLLIVAGDQQTHAIRTAIVALSGGLHLVTQVRDQSGDRIGRVVRVLVVEALGTQVPAKDTGIRRDPSNGNAQVIVNGDYLALGGRQLRGGLAQGNEHSGFSIFQAHSCGSKFHGLHCVLHLVEASLRTPHRNIAIVLVAKLKTKGEFVTKYHSYLQ